MYVYIYMYIYIYIYITETNFIVQSHSDLEQAVGRWRLGGESRVRSMASPPEICGGHSDTGTHFSPSTSVLSLSVSFHQCSIFFFFFLIILLSEGQAGEAWESLNK
jgi:hypothetical protein